MRLPLAQQLERVTRPVPGSQRRIKAHPASWNLQASEPPTALSPAKPLLSLHPHSHPLHTWTPSRASSPPRRRRLPSRLPTTTARLARAALVSSAAATMTSRRPTRTARAARAALASSLERSTVLQSTHHHDNNFHHPHRTGIVLRVLRR
uniref:Uncharacterized protein n=1 Tax=Mycena chlorophos TaxID=658473 RepID=A0ABQ0LNQ9_MYCCL|nr:predicted protein [Mycena chlorophos]